VSYEDLKGSAAILCEHISYPDRPILRATRDVPVEPEDSGWQFLCGVENHDKSNGVVWLLEELAGLDSSLRSILDSEPEASFERSTADGAWRAIPYVNDDEVT
jgi:hypothetical protein